MIVVAHRGPDALAHIGLPIWHAGLADGAELVDLLAHDEVTARYVVQNGAITLRDLARRRTLILTT